MLVQLRAKCGFNVYQPTCRQRSAAVIIIIVIVVIIIFVVVVWICVEVDRRCFAIVVVAASPVLTSMTSASLHRHPDLHRRWVCQHHTDAMVALQQLSGAQTHHPHRQLNDGCQQRQQQQNGDPVEQCVQRRVLVVAVGRQQVEGDSRGEKNADDEQMAETKREEGIEASRHDRRTPRCGPDVQLTQTSPEVIHQLPTNSQLQSLILIRWSTMQLKHPRAQQGAKNIRRRLGQHITQRINDFSSQRR